jgi:hypothetical protein
MSERCPSVKWNFFWDTVYVQLLKVSVTKNACPGTKILAVFLGMICFEDGFMSTK